MWRRLFEDCNKKQGEEIECLRQEYKKRSERLASTTAVGRTKPARNAPCRQSPMELLTPRELSQTTEVQIPTAAARDTMPDPSDTLGDPVMEQTMQKLVETIGRIVANKSLPGSSMTAPYGTIDDISIVELSMRKLRKWELLPPRDRQRPQKPLTKDMRDAHDESVPRVWHTKEQPD